MQFNEFWILLAEVEINACSPLQGMWMWKCNVFKLFVCYNMPISTMDHNFHMSKLRNFRSSVLKLQPSFRNLLVRDWRVEINAYMEANFFVNQLTLGEVDKFGFLWFTNLWIIKFPQCMDMPPTFNVAICHWNIFQWINKS